MDLARLQRSWSKEICILIMFWGQGSMVTESGFKATLKTSYLAEAAQWLMRENFMEAVLVGALTMTLANCNLSQPATAPLPPPPGGSVPRIGTPSRESVECRERVLAARREQVSRCITSGASTDRECRRMAAESHKSEQAFCDSLLLR